MPFLHNQFTLDAAGAGTWTSTESIRGIIESIVILYGVGAPPGTTLTVDQLTPPIIPILNLVGNVSGVWMPRASICDINSLTPIYYDVLGIAPPVPQVEVKDKIQVDGKITITFAAGGVGDVNDVWVVYNAKKV